MPISFRHDRQEAFELEFFVPAAVWQHDATRVFLSEVYALVEGATVVGDARGVWRGENESTNLVRIVVRPGDQPFDDLLSVVHESVYRVMNAWSESAGHRQESFMFTVRPLTVYETRLKGDQP